MLVEGRILNDLGVLYRKAGRADRARASHETALKLGEATNTSAVICKPRPDWRSSMNRRGN